MDVVLPFVLGVAAIISYLVLTYLVSNNKLKPGWKKPAKVVVNSVSGLILLFTVGILVFAIYRAADEHGWFAHDRSASVWMPSDWLVGEFKTCVLASGETMPVLDCSVDSGSTLHEMSVEFHGSLDALESKKQSNWKCQRIEQSINCADK